MVDLDSWRAGQRWRLGSGRVPVQTLAWSGRRRLLALVAGGLTPGKIVVADPAARKVVAIRRLRGRLVSWSSSALGITVILGPPSGIGAARLVHVDARGRTLTAALPGVSAGFVAPPRTRVPGQAPRSRVATPGLAIDEPDRLAFVATGDLRVLAINLRDGRVVTLLPAAGRSPVEQMGDWLQPAAQAKGVDGVVRSATYVGRGLLAVNGQDGNRPRPYGLRLVDLDRGAVRLISQGGYAYGARGRVLAVGVGKTLRAYDADGRRVWSRFPRGGIRDLTIGPRYAYVLLGQRTYVLDPRTGATVRVLPTGRPRSCSRRNATVSAARRRRGPAAVLVVAGIAGSARRRAGDPAARTRNGDRASAGGGLRSGGGVARPSSAICPRTSPSGGRARLDALRGSAPMRFQMLDRWQVPCTRPHGGVGAAYRRGYRRLIREVRAGVATR